MRKDKTQPAETRDSAAEIETVIGEGTVIEGIIDSASSLRVDGAVKGNIQCSNSVIIGVKGKVEGDISAKQLFIAGSITGNLTAEVRAEFASGAHLRGDLRTAALVVAEGAAIDGNCHMTEDPKKTAAVPAADK